MTYTSHRLAIAECRRGTCIALLGCQSVEMLPASLYLQSKQQTDVFQVAPPTTTTPQLPAALPANGMS